MKVLIVDDEQPARENILRKLTSFGLDLTIVGQAATVDEAAMLIKEKEPELVFLDIEMPEKDGFELLDMYEELPFKVIFVTAYNEYALRAFEMFAVGYVTKPIDDEYLKKTVENVIATSLIKSNVLSPLKESMDNKIINKVVIPSNTEHLVLDISDIILLEADGSYTNIIFNDRSKHVSTKRLKFFESAIENIKFVRVHRSFIINTSYLISFTNDGILQLKNGHEILINKNKRKVVRATISDALA